MLDFLFSSVQLLSHVRLFVTPNRNTPGLPVHHQLWSSPRLMCIESVMPSSHLILCRPLLLLPPIPPSIRVFSNESTLRIRWPKYWSFSLSISPSYEHPGLVSFRMDWLDLLAVQGIPVQESSPAPQFKSINSSFGQMYNNMYLSLSYHTEYFHCPKNPLCFLPSCPSLPHPITNP